jgi:hypothetical protein
MRGHIPVVLALLMLSALPASAQVTFDGCVDFRGVPVASVLNAQVNDVAVANWAPNGAPVIHYNPYVLARLSPQTRVFFYAHECAHHALAHAIRNIPFEREQEADCWAVRALVARGVLNPDGDVAAVQRDLSFSPGDWTHVPGPRRAFNLRACLASP